MIEIYITPFNTVYTKNCKNFSVKRENETTTLIIKHEYINCDYKNPLYEDFDIVGFFKCSVKNENSEDDNSQQEIFINGSFTFRFEEKEGETHFIFDNSYIEPKKTRSVREIVNMSDDLCEFFELPSGSRMSMLKIIELIKDYIIKHKLKNPECGNEFIPDAKLQKIFKNKPVKFFNMQNFLNKHFFEIK